MYYNKHEWATRGTARVQYKSGRTVAARRRVYARTGGYVVTGTNGLTDRGSGTPRRHQCGMETLRWVVGPVSDVAPPRAYAIHYKTSNTYTILYDVCA